MIPLISLISARSHLSTAAIHEIFATNAKRFPNRECVIETSQSPRTAQRTFTYRQINLSSNQLAHHFLAHGCKVGDVVMIYAYRGSLVPLLLFLVTD
jgi:non-ribosomal peptide synthetase component F